MPTADHGTLYVLASPRPDVERCPAHVIVADVVTLSDRYSGPRWRADDRAATRNLPRWALAAQDAECAECSHHGRIRARHTRHTTSGADLPLCSLHASLWKTRDLADLGVTP